MNAISGLASGLFMFGALVSSAPRGPGWAILCAACTVGAMINLAAAMGWHPPVPVW